VVFMGVVAMMTACILFQTENVVFPVHASLVPANPNDIVRAFAGEGAGRALVAPPHFPRGSIGRSLLPSL